MSSFDPLLWVQEQELQKQQAHDEAVSRKAGAKSIRSAQYDVAKDNLLQKFWEESYKEAAGDYEKARTLWTARANKAGIKDPETETKLLAEAKKSIGEGGVVDFVGGKLPPKVEEAVRKGEPWRPTPEMLVDEGLQSGAILPEERFDARKDYKKQAATLSAGLPSDTVEGTKQDIQQYIAQHPAVGAPNKASEIWNYITAPFQLGGKAVAGAIASGVSNIRKEQEAYRNEHPWVESMGGVGPTVGGIDLGLFLLDRPEVGQQLGEVASGAKENIVTDGRSADSSVPGYLVGVVKDYVKQYGAGALEQAQQELPWGSPEQQQDRAIDIVLEKTPETAYGKMVLEHPHLADFIIQTGGDPINATPLLKAALKPLLKSSAAKLGRWGEVIGDIKMGSERSGKTLGNAFNADYEIDKLIRRGLVKEGAQLSVVEPKARYLVQSTIDNLREKYLRPISKLVKPEDRELFYAALEGDAGAYTVVRSNPNLTKALELHTQLEAEHARLRDVTGQGQHWSDQGILLNPAELTGQHYIPHRVAVTPTSKTQTAWKFSQGRGLNQSKAGSSYSRSGEGGEFVPDVVQQWEAEFKDIAIPAQGSQQIKETSKILKEGNLQVNVPVAKANEAAENLTKAAGEKWLPLEDAVAEIWQRYGEAPLSIKKGTQATLVPETVVNQIRRLTAFADPKDPSKFGKLVADSIGFLNRSFSKMMTIPFFKFHEVQWAGNTAMAPLFFGADTISNRMIGSYAAGIANAWKNPSLMAKVPAVLPTGVKTNWGDIIQLARERGVVSPTNLLDMDLIAETSRKATGGIAEVPGMIEKGLRKASESKWIGGVPDKVSRAAKMSDDQFKLMAFSHFLEDTTPLAADIAAKKASEWAMNYNKLGWFEKDIISNVIPFYGWQKFVGTRIIKVALEHPERLAPFIKAYETAERKYGPNAPYTEKAVPEYLTGRGFTAPYDLQPPDQQAKIAAAILDEYDRLGRPKPGTDEFTMLTFESGAAMAAPIVTAMFGNDRKSALKSLFPVFNAMIEMGVGKDLETGDPLVRVPTNTTQYGASPVGRLQQVYTQRFTDQFKRLWMLAKDDPKMRADFQLRLKMANDLGWIGTELYNSFNEGQDLPEIPFGFRGNYIGSPVMGPEYERGNVLEDIQGLKKSERRGMR